MISQYHYHMCTPSALVGRPLSKGVYSFDKSVNINHRRDERGRFQEKEKKDYKQKIKQTRGFDPGSREPSGELTVPPEPYSPFDPW